MRLRLSLNKSNSIATRMGKFTKYGGIAAFAFFTIKGLVWLAVLGLGLMWARS